MRGQLAQRLRSTTERMGQDNAAEPTANQIKVCALRTESGVGLKDSLGFPCCHSLPPYNHLVFLGRRGAKQICTHTGQARHVNTVEKRTPRWMLHRTSLCRKKKETQQNVWPLEQVPDLLLCCSSLHLEGKAKSVHTSTQKEKKKKKSAMREKLRPHTPASA